MAHFLRKKEDEIKRKKSMSSLSDEEKQESRFGRPEWTNFAFLAAAAFGFKPL